MKQLKFEGYSMFARDIAEVIWSRIGDQLLNLGAPLVYVPSSQKTKRVRGFNQAEKICRYLSRFSGLEVKNLLTKKSGGQSQIGKTVQDRYINTRGSFEILQCQQPETVILVDDIMTTGATLEACARLLKLAGVKRVYAAVFARNPEFAMQNVV